MTVAVVFLPLLGAIIAGALAFARPEDKHARHRTDALAQRITCGALLASMVLAILVFWYAMAVVLNAPWARDQAERAGVALGPAALVAATMAQERPRLPAPHQVVSELWKTVVATPVGAVPDGARAAVLDRAQGKDDEND